MAGIEIAGLAFSVAPIVFKGILTGLKALDDTIGFDDDTEDLVIRLETAKAHLSIWGTNAGLTGGELLAALHPLNDLIIRTLQRIEGLIAEVEQQGKKYGLEPKVPEDKDAKKVAAVVVQMRRSLHSVLTSSITKTGPSIGALIEGEPKEGKDVSVMKRVYFAIRHKEKFENFVTKLEKHINGLQKLVFESQRRQIQQEGTRLSLQIVRALSNADELSRLQVAHVEDEAFSTMDLNYLAECKTIALQRVSSLSVRKPEFQDWTLNNATPTELAKTRFLKLGRIDPEVAYLFEKKDYDPNISDEDKDILQERIRKLVTLLSKPDTQRHMHTLQAVGHIDDPDHHCWWIIFRFPLGPLDTLTQEVSEPLSLRQLYKSPLKPALEARYKLAKRIVETFARLYGSEWMHKSISSSNIIFPWVSSPSALSKVGSIHTALVQGFGYSRQRTEAQTLDRGRVLNDLEAAIYRHPSYQGEAASGYQIQYDIYSLGLVLFEIALWGPLKGMLAANKKPGKEPPVALAPDMRHFHETEAKELKRRVDLRVEEEVAYRVGTKYKEVVKWCLGLSAPVSALAFYNAVAIPLDELCAQG